MDPHPSPMLVLGFSNSGKTHFGAQLLDRLRNGQGRVRLGGFPADLSGLEEALRKLQGGMLAQHTPATTYAELPLDLRSASRGDIRLVWPDYGGEQLRLILERRSIPAEWGTRLSISGGWILLVRPSTLNGMRSVPQRLEARLEAGAAPHHESQPKWDDNARYVELLQMFLSAAGVSTLVPVMRPKIAVVLSCWDELPRAESERSPGTLLSDYLPMFHSFLFANWCDSCSVWGLSSLGKSLSADHPDPDFVDKGPSAQGYVVRPDGAKTDDLTEPLEWLVGTDV